MKTLVSAILDNRLFLLSSKSKWKVSLRAGIRRLWEVPPTCCPHEAVTFCARRFIQVIAPFVVPVLTGTCVFVADSREGQLSVRQSLTMNAKLFLLFVLPVQLLRWTQNVAAPALANTYDPFGDYLLIGSVSVEQ